MAISGGPDIVEDGLVLHLDAAEPLCFRGEPTTNVVRYPVPNTSWTLGNANGSAGTRSFLTENGIDYMRLSNITAPSSTSYPRIVDQTLTSTVTGNVTASFEARGTTGSIVNFNIYENGSTKHSLGATMTSEWKRYSYSFNTSFNLNQPYFQPRTTGATYDIRNVQIEAKPYATNFVSGTRGSTVAAGGGLLDLTNNGNNGEINRTSVPSAAFYSGNNSWNFVFDGGNDYVDFNDTNLLPTEGLTVSVWFKTSVTNKWLLDKSNGGITNGWLLAGGSAGPMFFRVNPASVNTVNNINTNEWMNITATWTPSTSLIIYRNGIFDASNTSSIPSSITNPSATLRLGGRKNNSDWWNGSISQVSIYSKALPAKEVRQNFEATKGRYGL